MQIDLSVLTLAALTNGLNPCGIGMMITFLGYLLVFGIKGKTLENKKKNYQLLKVGAVYIVSVFSTYLVLGLLFYEIAFYMQRWLLAGFFKYLVGAAIIFAGLIQFKDVFWEELPLHLKMPKMGFEKINKLMAKTSIGVTVLVGVLTTIFSTPCMLPLYVGTTAVIARSGLPTI
jgi:cytochrome c biogenesis protein CcdA